MFNDTKQIPIICEKPGNELNFIAEAELKPGGLVIPLIFSSDEIINTVEM